MSLEGGNTHGGKTYRQAQKIALQLATGTSVVHVCKSGTGEAEQMASLVAGMLRDAGCFPVDKYTRRLKFHQQKEKVTH